MARSRRYEPLNVFLNSRQVGQLRRESSGAIEFQYDPEWLAWPHTLPVSLSMPLREGAYIGGPVSAVFENLLPDNDTLRNRIAARTRAEGIDAYSLLRAIGHDCVGALQFLHPDVDPGPAGTVSGTPVNAKEIANILANLATTPLGVSEDESFRISIAGAQEKTALLFWNKRWYKPQGTTATTHILKPSIGRLPNGVDLTHSVENEYLCLKLLESFGLPAAKARMAQFGERPVLVVERFDRLWTEDGRLLRIPQEDCCQALSVPPTLKYQSDGGPGIESILRLLRDGDNPAEDQRALIKTMIVFWLLGATDGHAKNFSVFLSPGGRYRMTPLYDVISAQPSVDAGEIRPNQFRLAMAVGDKRHYRINTIAPRHFLETAQRAGIGEQVVSSIFEELRDTAVNVVRGTLVHLPKDFPGEVATSIQLGINRRLQTFRTKRPPALGGSSFG
jgi:serine/threonine-protein kinase HipA